MTRTHAATRLLEHGALTFAEFIEITRWPRSTAGLALENLVAAGTVKRDRLPLSRARGFYVGPVRYSLAGGARA